MVDSTDPKPTKKAASRRDFLKAGLLGGAAWQPAPVPRGRRAIR